MRAIIIDDKDARALLDSLKLTALQAANHGLSPVHIREGATQKEIIEAAHGTFHYVVCRWLQEQGCNVVR